MTNINSDAANGFCWAIYKKKTRF